MYPTKRISELYDKNEIEISIAMGEPAFRDIIAQRLIGEGYTLATLVHPSVYVPDSTRIGSGTIICMDSFVSCDVTIGENVLVQSHASIGHDCQIGNHAVLSSFVSLAGKCRVGERAYIGMSVPVKETIKIGKDSIVGMGSVVLRDIQDGMIALGNPARPMKENVSKRVFAQSPLDFK
jgi:sugar O-acyltransferase (sialic acid O-acetyltransferase NeuD family)